MCTINTPCLVGDASHESLLKPDGSLETGFRVQGLGLQRLEGLGFKGSG